MFLDNWSNGNWHIAQKYPQPLTVAAFLNFDTWKQIPAEVDI